MKENDKKTINLLWTGDLDSTCRLCELSLMDVIVQPYYIIDKRRESIPHEIKAQNKILHLLRLSTTTRAQINDVIIIQMESVPEDKEITSANVRLREKYNLGLQYGFMERFAKYNNLQLEVGLEQVESIGHEVRGQKVVEVEGDLKEITIVDEVFVLGDNATSDCRKVFEHLVFPKTIWNSTKLTEWDWMHKNGFLQVAKATWFCHYPLFGMPCGHCQPCRDTKSVGMGFRIPLISALLSPLLKPKRTIRKIKLKIGEKF